MVNFIVKVPYNHIKDTFKDGDFANTEYFYKNEISLPIYNTLFIEYQTKVEKIKAIFNE